MSAMTPREARLRFDLHEVISLVKLFCDCSKQLPGITIKLKVVIDNVKVTGTSGTRPWWESGTRDPEL